MSTTTMIYDLFPRARWLLQVDDIHVFRFMMVTSDQEREMSRNFLAYLMEYEEKDPELVRRRRRGRRRVVWLVFSIYSF